ncbi:DUF2785 domain-containing protein [Clostridium sp. 19966]|uniref:DUF2785 domain-containing protein n=1 Tax=Clostridium sp. 19966 TaxID=2768166 RepID=UPI0028E09737|nr:DUF2785 domain-containing protein [Clostridium sp. 19966]MDT8716892.1 DUF2785 domain-containing protein [Clostridium sp. 19966]
MKDKEFELKEKLSEIKNNKYLLPNGEEHFLLALEMMDNIGSLDSELRDELIYEVLFHWIMEKKLNSEELKKLLAISMDNEHVFYKLYEADEDAVFKRTFSVLIVALILYKHREEEFIENDTLYDIKNKLIEYMLKEKDLRGYVEVKGWAHSAAHTADALDELLQCSCFEKKDVIAILDTIKFKAAIGYYGYIDEEYERMATPLESAINAKLLNNSEVIEWLKDLIMEEDNLSYIQKYHSKVNKKQFLKSLYFRLLDKEEYENIIAEIKNILVNL